MTNYEQELDDLFRRYKESCGDPEAAVDFMPKLWGKIENRRNFWFAFVRLARTAATAVAAVCVLVLLLDFAAPSPNLPEPTYADALAADHSAERTYFAEAIRPSAGSDEVPSPDSGSR